jgi:hypothetical protein
MMLVARSSGVILQLAIPSLALLATLLQLTNPQNPEVPLDATIAHLYINCDSTKVIIVDMVGVARLLQLGTKQVP